MQRKKLLGLYGLKWNPFTPDVPNEGLYTTARIESFVRRIETMVHDGGFALITGEPGYGKSIALRIIEEQLAELPDVSVGVLARPQSGVADFYRELGDLFGLELRPHNRWAGFKTLRERWKAHADASLVLAGDTRLADRFRHPELLPIGSRIRTRLVLDYASQDELRDVLRHALKKAGAPKLLTENLQEVLIDHAAGNYRVLMTMAGELLMAACERELPVIDEKLYLELFEERSTGRRAKNRRTKA